MKLLRNWEPQISLIEKQIDALQSQINIQQEEIIQIMSTQAALDQVITALQATLQTTQTDIANIITALQNSPAATDLTNEINSLGTINTALQTADTNITNALTPAPAPTPPAS